MKSIILLLVIIGIIFIAVGYIKSNQSCPPPIVQYRYYPRTFEEEETNPVPVSAIFGKMFNNADAWEDRNGLLYIPRTKQISNLYDSQ